MAVVVSTGTLTEVGNDWWPIHRHGRVRLYNDYTADYATIYKTQPNVRTCVDFLARNIAQLGLHVFRTVSDTDRERLRDHPLAQVIARPLPPEHKVTRYRLIETLLGDLGVFFNAYWLKIRQDALPVGLLRIPPQYVSVAGGLVPSLYEIQMPGLRWDIAPEDIVHFRGYSAESAVSGLSPLETLRRVLAEEHAAGDYREHFWQNAARMHGVLERPIESPEWSVEARQRFKQEFEALYSGGESSGKTAILEEGMTWRQVEFNAQESEYMAGRKLTREECARAYHIPPPMVGILDHATFSNITEQTKMLYRDTLGPWLAMIEEEIELQLLPEFGDIDGVYVEFNIEQKLAGSFEEQTAALQSAVGRPWMTANEARARVNLPGLEEGDTLVTPLNVLTGGQANPRDTAPGSRSLTAQSAQSKALDVHNQELRERHEERWRRVLVDHYERQRRAILPRVPEVPGKGIVGDIWYDEERWNRELYGSLLGMNTVTAETWAGIVVQSLDADINPEKLSEGMERWLSEHSRVQAAHLNGYVAEELEQALMAEDPRSAVGDMFRAAVSVWAVRQAVTAVTTASSFGATEGASAAGLRSKTWQVNSGNPRDSHAALNGMTVGIRERFPNGQRWPGDPAGGADENANCMCSVSFD